MAFLPPEPDQTDTSPPVLNYLTPHDKDPHESSAYVRVFCLLVGIPAILIAIPFGIGGVVMVWRWIAGTVTADGNDGLRFLIASGLLMSFGIVLVSAGLRFHRSRTR